MASYLGGGEKPSSSSKSSSGGGSYLSGGSKAAKEPKKRQPQEEAARQADRAHFMYKGKKLSKSQRDAVKTVLDDASKSGVPVSDSQFRALGFDPVKMPTGGIQRPNIVSRGVGQVLEQIGRPGQAIRSGLAEAAKPGDDGGAMLRAMAEGFKLKRHDDISDAVENFTDGKVKLTGAAKFATNLVGGIATDPLTYMNLPSNTLASVGQTRLLKAAAETGPGKALAESFIPRAAVTRTFGKEAADAIDVARVRYHATVRSNIEDDLNRISTAAKRAGASDDELRNVVGRALDIGGRDVPVPSHLAPLVDELRGVRDRFTKAQIDSGVAQADALHITEEYFPRYVTKEGRKLYGLDAAEEVTPTAVKALTTAPSKKLKGRTANLEDAAVDVVDDAGKAVYETDPRIAFGRRATEAHRDVGRATMLDDLVRAEDVPFRRIDETVESLEDGATRTTKTGLLDGEVEINVPRVGKFAAPKEIADEVQHVLDLTIHAPSVDRVFRGLDKWMGLWKPYATSIDPGFHLRNNMGNWFLNDLAGVNNPRWYTRAMSLQRKMARGVKDGDVYKHLTEADRGLVREMREHGVVGGGFYDVDMAASVAGQVGGKARGLAAKAADNPLTRTGRKVGNAVEDNARIAHYLAKRPSLGAEGASKSVRKYLFDYGDLTPVERQVFRRVNGFYTFTRKNLPRQLEALMTTPGKVSRYQHLREALISTAPTDGYELTPEYLRESGATPLPQGFTNLLSKIPGLDFEKDQPAVLGLGDIVPFGQSVKAVSPFVNLAQNIPGVGAAIPGDSAGTQRPTGDLISTHFVGGAPGALSALAQHALGKQFFAEKQLSGRPVDVPIWDPRAIISLGKSKAKMTENAKFLIEQNMPLLAKVSSLIPRGEAGKTGAGRRRLGSLTGLRVNQLNDATRDQEARRILDQFQELISRLKDEGVEVPDLPKARRR